jgi:hypothetical protein
MSTTFGLRDAPCGASIEAAPVSATRSASSGVKGGIAPIYHNSRLICRMAADGGRVRHSVNRWRSVRIE